MDFDDTRAAELFERAPRFTTLEEIHAALQLGIYGIDTQGGKRERTGISFLDRLHMLDGEK